MRVRMSKTLGFWVENDHDRRQDEHEDRTESQLLAEILYQFEAVGDAMRYLNSRGQIAWKATIPMEIPTCT